MDDVVVRIKKLIDKNKAIAAFLAPLVTGLLVILGHWIVTGEFNAEEIRLLVGDFVLAAAAGIGAFLAPAKEALVEHKELAAAIPAPSPIEEVK